MPKCIKKVIVFDLDDTIGHFEEISIFLSGLQAIVSRDIKDKYIFNLLDLFPKFLRPGIFDILEIIKKEKKKNKCVKVIIYTNNMGPRSWTLLIKKYLENKIKYPIFDKVITAYRPGEHHNCRTTYEKTHSDLLKCTGYKPDSKFLFLDDQYHPKMRHPMIKYLHLAPYNYGIEFNQMIDLFLKSKYGSLVKQKYQNRFRNYMYKYMSSGNINNRYIVKRSKIYKKDIHQLRTIQKQMRKFLDIKRTKNKRKKKRSRSKTRKNK
jgi:predicted DNA-binding protein YlxM (UPF0122 family)